MMRLPGSDGQRCAAVAAWVLTRSVDGVAAEPSSGAGGEQRVAGATGAFGRARRAAAPATGPVSGTRALLAALAFAADVRAGAEGDVGAVQAGEFGDPQPGLDGEQEQGAVASTFPAGRGRGRR